MIRKVLFTTFMIVMLTLGGAFGVQNASALPEQPVADTTAQYAVSGYWEYRWFCYSAPQLTYNLQYVNAALYKRFVFTQYAGGPVKSVGPYQWVQNAWQWFCPQY